MNYRKLSKWYKIHDEYLRNKSKKYLRQCSRYNNKPKKFPHVKWAEIEYEEFKRRHSNGKF